MADPRVTLDTPILVEPQGEHRNAVLSLRPLFFSRPCVTDRRLGRGTSRLVRKLRERLDLLAKMGEYDKLARFGFSPDVSLERVRLRLELPGHFFRGRCQVATFRQLGRRLAFVLREPGLWFEINKGETVADRTTDVLVAWLKRVEKDEGRAGVGEALKRFELPPRAWITHLRLPLSTRQTRIDVLDRLQSLAGEMEQMDGDGQLEKIGRCIDRLYPDELTRAAHREREVKELVRLFSARDRRPVMLLGPPQVGKTAVLHEFVYRRVAARKNAFSDRRGTWLVAPQRLVSGMSYVGQWENRLLAILKTMQKRDQVLYIDDMLGMYRAGTHSRSDLSAANLLKPHVERREVRVVAEMTAEQFRAFRERDRGFADLFHLVRIEEPTAEVNRRILVATIRSLESATDIRFGIDVLPTVLELTRRYQPDQAYPGKAVGRLRELAVKYPGRAVGRTQALLEFGAKTGLQVSFVNRESKFPRAEVVEALSQTVIGQRAALGAMTDVVCVARALLNDPRRPLGSLLFLGPTGVGKTHCAKTLAGYLFGDPSRLVRFDMNEFVSPLAVARLVGTFDQPEGLLTSAVRHQPFSVLLFDEIEKAHRDVFDLLLQVLGEGRLTDSLGRTADFSNTVIILTSNLGTREAARQVGFQPTEPAAADSVYLKAVREFFRPEFVNRFDRIVPFSALSRDELRLIAEKLVEDLLTREGLSRRKCAIDIDGAALEWIIDRGIDRTLGARAMRRALERDLVRPLARQMAAVIPETPTILTIRRSGDELDVEVTTLEEAERSPATARPGSIQDPEDTLLRVQAALDRLEGECEAHRPAGEFGARLDNRQRWYLGVCELLKDIRSHVSNMAEQLRDHVRSSRVPVMPLRQRRRNQDDVIGTRRVLKEMLAAHNIVEYLDEVMEGLQQRRSMSTTDTSQSGILNQLALAHVLAPGNEGWTSERQLVIVRSLGDTPYFRKWSVPNLQFMAGSHGYDERHTIPEFLSFGLDETSFADDHEQLEDHDQRRRWSELIKDDDLRARCTSRLYLDVILYEGHGARLMTQLQQGTHLWVTDHGRLQPVQLICISLGPDEDVSSALAGCLTRHLDCRATGRTEDGADHADPFCWQPVVTITRSQPYRLLNLRTGRNSHGLGDLLPLPPELET